MSGRTLVVGSVTHRGYAKSRNEDSVLVGDWVSTAAAGVPTLLALKLTTEPVLVAVCDGLGGHPAGDEASLYAIDSLRRRASTIRDQQVAATALAAVGADLHQLGAADTPRSGMGTTAVVLSLFEDTVIAANVGDSPLYEYSGGLLTQLSMLDEIPVPPGEGRGSVLTQSLGPHGSNIDVHTLAIDLSTTDGARTFLLCSDGLSDFVPLSRIEDVIAAAPEPPDAVPTLLADALEAGGKDNISIIVATVLPAAALDSPSVAGPPNDSGETLRE